MCAHCSDLKAHIARLYDGTVDPVFGFAKEMNELDLPTSPRVVGCDGTAVNTGKHTVAITIIEQHIGSAVQWSICQFHLNELPLRHLFGELDGKSSGPQT